MQSSVNIVIRDVSMRREKKSYMCLLCTERGIVSRFDTRIANCWDISFVSETSGNLNLKKNSQMKMKIFFVNDVICRLSAPVVKSLNLIDLEGIRCVLGDV